MNLGEVHSGLRALINNTRTLAEAASITLNMQDVLEMLDRAEELLDRARNPNLTGPVLTPEDYRAHRWAACHALDANDLLMRLLGTRKPTEEWVRQVMEATYTD